MANRQTLTVGLPVYNAMPHLPETVESLLAQTYSDFEILAINDGSTDESLDYLKSIRDPRLRVISQENHGLTATLNRMLAETGTAWLVRHDADDVAYPERLARTVRAIEEHPDAGMFYSLADYFPQTRSVGSFRATLGSPHELRGLTEKGFLLSICHPTVTLNKGKALLAGGYRFNLHVEDIDLWWRMALNYEVRFIPVPTIGFRQNHQSVSSRNLETQALNTLYIQYLLLSHLWQKEPLAYDRVITPLRKLLNLQQLRFKKNIRDANMSLAQGQKGRAAIRALAALCASPTTLLERTLHEFRPRKLLSLGTDPERFRLIASELWPYHEPASKAS